MRQAKQRIFGGYTHVAEKLVSIFEPTPEIIRKGKASKPTEFGKMVKIQETESQIITDYAVYAKRPSDSDLLIGAIETHEQRLGCMPRLAVADAAFYSAKNEATAHEKGVVRVCIPNGSTKSAERCGRQFRARERYGRCQRSAGWCQLRCWRASPLAHAFVDYCFILATASAGTAGTWRGRRLRGSSPSRHRSARG